MRIIEDVKLDFQDVLITPKRSTLTSRADVTIERTFKFKHSGETWSGVPIIAANMDHTGTIPMLDALAKHHMMVALHKFHYEKDFNDIAPQSFDYFFKTIGIEDMKNVLEMYQPKKVCIDVANGYTERFLEFVSRVRATWPATTIMAGNVVTPEMTEALILAGADIVKVGIGPGSVCTTRLVAGVGYPQLSAVIECADAAHGIGGLVCSDGGCTTPGDIAKAFGAGADFVMLGGMLAGHDECSGEVTPPKKLKEEMYREIDRAFKASKEADPVTRQTRDHQIVNLPGHEGSYVVNFEMVRSHKDLDMVINQLPRECFTIDPNAKMKFYGMSSEAAMEKYSGGVAKHRASEGKEVLVPYKGSVNDTVQQILGGLRSACTYTGSKTLKELPKRTTFVRVNRLNNQVFK